MLHAYALFFADPIVITVQPSIYPYSHRLAGTLNIPTPTMLSAANVSRCLLLVTSDLLCLVLQCATVHSLNVGPPRSGVTIPLTRRKIDAAPDGDLWVGYSSFL